METTKGTILDNDFDRPVLKMIREDFGLIDQD
jgi:hypothetical protein